MTRFAIYIICIAAVLLVILGCAAEFIRFYIKPVPAAGAKVVWGVQHVMPCRPVGHGFVVDNYRSIEKSCSHDGGNSKSSRSKGKRNDDRFVEDALTQAEIIFEEADEEKTKELQESGIFYLSWLKVLVSFGDAQLFIVGMIAVMCNIFFGTDVKKWGLPRYVEEVLKSFVPIIEANRRRRNNGQKGAEHGYKGGRPRTQGESPVENPTGVIMETPNVNEKESDKDNVSYSVNDNKSLNEYDDIPVTVRTWKTAGGLKQKIYYSVLAVFFFRNLRDPEKQTEKILRYFAAKEWPMKEVNDETAVREWVQHANRWDVNDDPMNRFNKKDLDMWEKLYNNAPELVKQDMLDDHINFKIEKESALIFCPEVVKDWMDNESNQIWKIVGPWSGGRRIIYQIILP